jgi:hypothetical protein
MSARERPPSGITNRAFDDRSKNSHSKKFSDTFTTSTSRLDQISESAREKLNCPLHVHPSVPMELVEQSSQNRVTPILPKSRFSTVPSARTPPRSRRPLACPNSWIEHNQESTWYDKDGADFKTNEDYERKMQYLRPFIDRNQNRLSRLDSHFYNQNPEVVRDSILKSGNFIAQMRELESRELNYVKLRSSDQIRKTMKDDHLKPVREPCFDPFKISMSTTRDERSLQYNTAVNTAVASELQNYTKQFHRGYCHALGSEYGNFSRYNSVLKTNEQATLKR